MAVVPRHLANFESYMYIFTALSDATPAFVEHQKDDEIRINDAWRKFKFF